MQMSKFKVHLERVSDKNFLFGSAESSARNDSPLKKVTDRTLNKLSDSLPVVLTGTTVQQCILFFNLIISPFFVELCIFFSRL